MNANSSANASFATKKSSQDGSTCSVSPRARQEDRVTPSWTIYSKTLSQKTKVKKIKPLPKTRSRERDSRLSPDIYRTEGDTWAVGHWTEGEETSEACVVRPCLDMFFPRAYQRQWCDNKSTTHSSWRTWSSIKEIRGEMTMPILLV